MEKTNKFWWLALIRGIILIVLGLFVFQHPVGAILGLTIYIAVSLLFTGITQTVLALQSKDVLPNWGWALSGGIIDILFALILLLNPVLTATTLPFIIGFWIIFYGVMTFVNSFARKKDGAPNWWWDIVTGMLAVLVGLLITSNLFTSLLAITYWIGFGFLIGGVINLIETFMLKTTKK